MTHECPTCDRKFDSELGLKQHHAKTHGESIKGKPIKCDNCGEITRKRQSRIEKQEKHFCNYDCRDEFYQKSEMFTRENNPRWAGGSLKPYGCGWEPLRKQILEEDEECQSCGNKESLVVHHVKPVRSFEKEEKAHYKENLVTLCRVCHPTYETMDVEEQIERLNNSRIEK